MVQITLVARWKRKRESPLCREEEVEESKRRRCLSFESNSLITSLA
jgi:hypothetical protein